MYDRKHRMNLPNLLTLLRILFVPLLVAALLAEDLGVNWARLVPVSRELFALGIFLAAAATDLIDGYFARRWRQVTTVGTLLDPIADKLLISAALISLVEIQRVPAWMVILIIGREFAVTGLRSIAARRGSSARRTAPCAPAGPWADPLPHGGRAEQRVGHRPRHAVWSRPVRAAASKQRRTAHQRAPGPRVRGAVQ